MRLFYVSWLAIAIGCGDDNEESRCSAGMFSNGSACMPWSACGAGEYVTGEPSAVVDRTCAPCEEGTFGDTENAPGCSMWTACADGYIEDVPGTATSDRTCREATTGQFGTGEDDFAYAVSVDSNGNVLVAGETRGVLPGQTTVGSTSDAFVRKYDSELHLMWTRQFGPVGNSDAVAKAVAVDAQGNSVVVGHLYGNLSGQTSAGGVDAFVRKYDSAGTEIWTRQFGSDSEDLAASVAIDADGNVFVAGQVFTALPSQTSAGAQDAFLRKYDSAGTEAWTRQFGSTGTEDAFSVCVDANGDVLVVGSTSGTFPDETSAGSIDAFVRKYDTAGTALWTDQFGSTGNGVKVEHAYAVTTDAESNVYVAGTTGSTLTGQTSAGSSDAFLRKYDSLGVETWTRQFGTASPEAVLSASVDAAGHVIVVGDTTGQRCGTSVSSAGTADGFVREFDSSGTEVDSSQLASAGDDHACSVSANAGAVAVAGATTGVLQGVSNLGGFDAFVLKVP